MSAGFAMLKTAHILGAAVLFGTGIGIAFFGWFGYRSALRNGEIASLRAVLRLTVIADAALTAPAVLFQALSGVALMRSLGWPYLSAWALATWALFLFVGACWLPVVAIQIRLARKARAAASVAALPESFHRSFRVWFALGVPAFASVVAIIYLMVAKPLSVG